MGDRVISIDELPVLDDAGEEFARDPYRSLREARERCWLVRSSLGVTVLTYAEGLGMYRDDRFIQPHLPMYRSRGITEGRMFDAANLAGTSHDGPEHLRLRRLVSAAFTPKRIEQYREYMRSIIEASVERVAAAGRCEFVDDIALGYPMAVICRMLGVPDADRPLFHDWLDAEMTILQWGEIESHRNVFDDLYDYLSDLLERRRKDPDDDLITALLDAEDGDDRLTHDEVIWQINMLLGAGQDTTRCQLGLAMLAFVDHLDQWDRLAAQPELVTSAVEEVLRFMPTLMNFPKIAGMDLDLHGVAIPAGTPVFVSYPAANRDPAAYDDPERFDITRTGNPPLTFGHGVHYCLGAMLARLEMREALTILARRFRQPALDGEPILRPPSGITGPDRLPLRFTAAP